MDINPNELPHREVYKLLTGSVVPRAIAWVSTVDAEGRPNLAPFSFFTVVCPNPPTIVFCPSIRGTDGGHKDTYHNIQTTGEFVVNFVTEPLLEAMNVTATELPAGVDEFERAGLTAIPSSLVRPPRVAESPIHFECTLNQIITISEAPGGGSLVIGTVVHMHFDESVLDADNHVDLVALQPVGRLMGPLYSRVNAFIELHRFPSEIARKD